MARMARIANTLALLGALALPAGAQEAGAPDIDALLARLADPAATPAEARQTAADIAGIWSRSGSATADLLLRRGRDALAAGDARAAADHLGALTDHAPDFAEGWHARAQAHFMLDRPGLAIADLRRALALEPRHFDAWAGLGAILMQIDRPAAALDAWQRALALNPHLDIISGAAERLDIQENGRDT
jgi:Flp pilus assembly protein TadD